MIIVSFPRSGQNLLESILRFLCESHSINFTYCEYYNCCNQIPCKKGSIVSKSHDFELDLEIKEKVKYISLYRKDPILQLESYFRYMARYKNLEYNYKNLLDFIKGSKNYYQNFVKKWITNTNSNILKVEYYDLIKDPVKFSESCFRHFFDCDLDKDILNSLKDKELSVHSGFRNSPRISSKIRLQNDLSEEIYLNLISDLPENYFNL